MAGSWLLLERGNFNACHVCVCDCVREQTVYVRCMRGRQTDRQDRECLTLNSNRLTDTQTEKNKRESECESASNKQPYKQADKHTAKPSKQIGERGGGGGGRSSSRRRKSIIGCGSG